MRVRKTTAESFPRLMALGIACLAASAATAQDAVPNKAPRFDPAAESNQLGEAQRLDRIARQRALTQRMAQFSGYGPNAPGIFEPWPFVPGDIWGYRLPAPIAQPIGHESWQSGPNTWNYRPLYAAPVAVQPMLPTAIVIPRVGPAPPAANGRLPGAKPLPPSAREF